MFNLDNIDKVLVQDTHLEAIKRKHGFEDVSKQLPEFEKELKGKGNSKKVAIQMKDEEKPTYLPQLKICLCHTIFIPIVVTTR